MRNDTDFCQTEKNGDENHSWLKQKGALAIRPSPLDEGSETEFDVANLPKAST